MAEPVTSKTAVEADWTCPRSRYYLTEYQGIGLVPVKPNEDKEIGIRLHLGVETLLNTKDFDKALHVIQEIPLTDPWQTWLEAMLYAWWTRVLPALLRDYEIVMVEKRLSFVRHGVRFKCFPDLVLRSKKDGTLWIYDFKSYKRWDTRRYLRAIQLQIGTVAVQEELKEDVAGSIIQGFRKAETRKDQVIHPLVFGYKREGEAGVTKTAYSYGWKRGFERFNVLSFDGGYRAWVDAAPDSVIADCFPQTEPIFLVPAMMDAFVEQRAHREKQIAACRDDLPRVAHDVSILLPTVFPQSFSECESDWHRCDYWDACHIPTVNRDPLGSGIYKLRFDRGPTSDTGAK